MWINLVCLITLGLFGCQTPTPSKPVDSVVVGKRIELWATHYYVQSANSITAGVALRDKQGKAISPTIAKADFCACAIEGTCNINGQNYDWVGRGTTSWTSCAFYSSKWGPSAEKSLWQKSKHEYGIGNRNNALEPFVSIAADQTIYPFGTRIYIPSAKGVKLPDGSLHDGWFRVDDVGGAIKGNHIDVFIGSSYKVFKFPFVKSSPKGTFEAYLK